MSEKRQVQRFIVKLPVTVSAGGKSISGDTVRISRKGLFVRTQQSFVTGVPVDIEITLTDMTSCKLKGIIKHARNYGHFLPRLNGMGIQFTETDPGYEAFITAIERERGF
ncbi:MAG: PilZ domain-containing protein [Nitrospiraceae bacterium]|nr:PilZ domain-containing protein [Nitrospiraceae bacterium]